MTTGACGSKKERRKSKISPTTSTFHQNRCVLWHNSSLDTMNFWNEKKRLWVKFLKVTKPRLKICLSKHICPSLRNGPVPRNLVDSFMFLVPYQGRMSQKSQNENAASATLKLHRGKSRVGLTRIGRKVTGKQSKKERKKVERSRDDSG